MNLLKALKGEHINASYIGDVDLNILNFLFLLNRYLGIDAV